MAQLNKNNMVHEMAQWKNRCCSELDAAAKWHDNWGFLLEHQKKDEPADQESSLLPSTVTQNSTGTTGTKKSRDIMAEKMRYRDNRSKVPKEYLDRPKLTSHQYGWYPSVEMPLTGEHNLKRMEELVPEM